MGRRPRVNSCQSEGFGYEKCDQVKPIIAAQKVYWRKCGRATCCSSSNLLELSFGVASEQPTTRKTHCDQPVGIGGLSINDKVCGLPSPSAYRTSHRLRALLRRGLR